MNYAARIIWTGNRGDGTATYTSYDREYRIEVRDKPDLAGTSDPAFRGDPHKHNPEDLFLAAISSCHMLFYLSLCAKHGIRVIDYVDDATGTMRLDPNGGGRFVEITLHPVVTIASGDVDRAVALHEDAHDRCFIANSCNVPIHHQATIHLAAEVRA